MRISLFLLILSSSLMRISGQDLEISGKAKIGMMLEDNTADSVVVRQSDGTLGLRGISTLAELQILRISNDTIFLTNGGYVKLPMDEVDDADSSPSNELQGISRTGSTVTLSNGGGSYQDSVLSEAIVGGMVGEDIRDSIRTMVMTTLRDTSQSLRFDIAASAAEANALKDSISTHRGDLTTLYASDTSSTNEIQGLSEVLSRDSLANHRIKNVIDPVDGQDAVTKAYVDDLIIGFGLTMGSSGIERLLNIGFNLVDLISSGATPIELWEGGVPADSIYGKTYAGGLIFYLDTLDIHPTFEGLVAAPTDAPTGLPWGYSGYGDGCNSVATGARSTGIGAGATNTMTVLNAACDSTWSAFNYVDTLRLGGYGDWFLPSKDELYEMYKHLPRYNCSAALPGRVDNTLCPTSLGGFAADWYWSSTENDYNIAWLQFFDNGRQLTVNKFDFTTVRAVRAF